MRKELINEGIILDQERPVSYRHADKSGFQVHSYMDRARDGEDVRIVQHVVYVDHYGKAIAILPIDSWQLYIESFCNEIDDYLLQSNQLSL